MRWSHQIACGIALTLGVSLRADEFTTAAGYYGTRQWRDAVAAFDQMILLAPDHPHRADAEFFRAEALVQLQEYDMAEDRFRAFVATYPDHPLGPCAEFRRGECRYLQGRFTEAIDLLRRFTEAHPQHELNEYALPYLAFSLDMSPAQATDDVRRILEHSLARYPRGRLAEVANFRLIELDYRDGNVDKIRQRLEAMQRDFPNAQRTPEWRYAQGLWYQATDRTPEALAEFDVASRPDASVDTQARALFQAAQLTLSQGDTAAALSRFEALAGLAGEHWQIETAYLQRIRLLIEQSRTADARKVAQEFLTRFPESERAREVRRLDGEAALADRDFEHAIEVYRGLAQADGSTAVHSPTDRAVSSYQLAGAYYQAARYSEAEAALAGIDLSQLMPAMVARIEYVRGNIQNQQGQLDEALLSLDRAAQADHDSTFADRVRWKRVALLTDAERWEEACQEYRRWVPTEQASWFYRRAGRKLAEAAYAAGQYDLASSTFALLLTNLRQPADAAYGLSGMAWCYLRQEKWETAAELFQRLNQQFDDDPHFPRSVLAHAYSLEMTGSVREAIELYRQFIYRFPHHPDRWRADLKAAELLEKQSAYTDALMILEDGLQVAADDRVRDRMRYLMAWLRRRLGQNDAARQIFREIHGRGRESHYWADATYRLAKDAFARRDLESARALADELLGADAVATARIRPYVLYLNARMAALLGDWQGVLQTLDQLQISYADSPLALASRVWSIDALYRLGDHDNVLYRLESLRDADLELKTSWQRLLDLREAQSLAETGEVQLAVERIQLLADREPHDRNWAEAILLIGQCELQLGNYLQARQALKRLMAASDQFDRDTYDAGLCLLGEAYYGERKYRESLDCYLHVRSRGESRLYAAALLGAAENLSKLGRRGEAASILNRLANSSLDTPYRQEARRLIESSGDDFETSAYPQLPVSSTVPQWERSPSGTKGTE